MRQVSEQYEKVSTTRARKLIGVVDKIKGEAEEGKFLDYDNKE